MVLDMQGGGFLGLEMQIWIVHGFNEKGEQELIAKQPPKFTYKYPPP